MKANNLLDETLDVDVRDGGFKLGGVLLDVGIEYCVPVVLVTLDGNTVAVLFWETDLYEVDEEVDVELKRTYFLQFDYYHWGHLKLANQITVGYEK